MESWANADNESNQLSVSSQSMCEQQARARLWGCMWSDTTIAGVDMVATLLLLLGNAGSMPELSSLVPRFVSAGGLHKLSRHWAFWASR